MPLGLWNPYPIPDHVKTMPQGHFSLKASWKSPMFLFILISCSVLKGVQEKLWKLGKLNHVAIAVPDLGKSPKPD